MAPLRPALRRRLGGGEGGAAPDIRRSRSSSFRSCSSAGVAGSRRPRAAAFPAAFWGGNRAATLPTAVFLAVRRLAAAGAVLTALLAVVTAVAFGSYFYSEAVASSLDRRVLEKAYVAYGGDVQGLVSDTTSVPHGFAFPADASRLRQPGRDARQPERRPTRTCSRSTPAPSAASSAGTRAWGADPRGSLGKLAHPQQGSLAGARRGNGPATISPPIWLDGVRIPVSVIGTATDLPGHERGTTPLLVVDRAALVRVGAAARHASEPARRRRRPTSGRTGPHGCRRAGARGCSRSRRRSSSTIDAVPKAPRVVLAHAHVLLMRRSRSVPAWSRSPGSSCTSRRGSARRGSPRRSPPDGLEWRRRDRCRSCSSSGGNPAVRRPRSAGGVALGGRGTDRRASRSAARRAVLAAFTIPGWRGILGERCSRSSSLATSAGGLISPRCAPHRRQRGSPCRLSRSSSAAG